MPKRKTRIPPCPMRHLPKMVKTHSRCLWKAVWRDGKIVYEERNVKTRFRAPKAPGNSKLTDYPGATIGDPRAKERLLEEIENQQAKFEFFKHLRRNDPAEYARVMGY